jgi:hypothetical protein
MRGPSRKAFFATFLLVALLVAGVGSYYASAHPDGLNSVAEKTGFSDQERSSGASDGPLAGYRTHGIDDARLSGGVAGVVGCLLVLTLAGGLAWAVRRRGPADDAESDVESDADRDDARSEA